MEEHQGMAEGYEASLTIANFRINDLERGVPKNSPIFYTLKTADSLFGKRRFSDIITNMDEKSVFSNRLQRWMAEIICQKKYFYLDRWSFVHFTSGLILGFIFSRYIFIDHAWLLVLVILIAYEFFELAISSYLLRRESTLDKIWDIIIGMAGFLVVWLWS